MDFFTGDLERVGFIRANGEIVEVENIAREPTTSFAVSARDLLRFEDEDVVATWHTHPAAGSNLSSDDVAGFMAWPKLKHYVVGTDGVRCYVVKNKVIHNA